MDWRIPLFKIYQDEEDIEAVTGVLRSEMNWATGDEVAGFEEALANYLGTGYCLTFNSGTSALHAVLLAYGIGPGAEVIVPSFTFISTANAPLFTGARPVFADIEETTCGLDPADVASKITERTKAIIPVHYAGCPCLINELRQVAREHNVLLIEDAAEALGAEAHGTKAGAFGDASVLSFCQNKVITTGEGGAVVTGSPDIYEKLKLIRSHGRADTADYFSTTAHIDYVSLGYNFRLSNLSAALGLAQLRKIERLIEMRREKAGRLTGALSPVEGLLPPLAPEGFRHVYQMYSIRVPAEYRDGLQDCLAGNGIMSKVNFFPVHLTEFYKNRLGYDCRLPVTETVARQILTLPLYPQLGERDIEDITRHITTYLAETA